jgi:GcrA cell cycle regulator
MRRWTSEESNRLRELAALRWPGRRIAEVLGKTPRALFRYAGDNGIRICSRYVDRYTAEDEALIRRLAADGKSSRQIAEALGGNRRKCGVSNWCIRHGISLQNNSRRKWTPETIERLRWHVSRGTRRDLIAAELGMTKFAICGKISEVGIKMWNEDRQSFLELRAAQGASGTEIAAEMGLTRNAVIGRANRTKVKLLGPRPGRPKYDRKEAKAKCRQRYIAMGLTSQGKPRAEPRPKTVRPPRPYTPAAIWIEPDDPGILPDAPRGVGDAVLELSRRGCVCHWPHGDPLEEDFTFCYAPARLGAQLPYCEFHLEKSRGARTPRPAA